MWQPYAWQMLVSESVSLQRAATYEGHNLNLHSKSKEGWLSSG